MENEIEKLAAQQFPNESGLDQEASCLQIGFIEGYKTAQSKTGWTNEDIKEALRIGVNIGMQNAIPDEYIGIRWDIEKMVSDCSDYLKNTGNKQPHP